MRGCRYPIAKTFIPLSIQETMFCSWCRHRWKFFARNPPWRAGRKKQHDTVRAVSNVDNAGRLRARIHGHDHSCQCSRSGELAAHAPLFLTRASPPIRVESLQLQAARLPAPPPDPPALSQHRPGKGIWVGHTSTMENLPGSRVGHAAAGAALCCRAIIAPGPVNLPRLQNNMCMHK